MSPRFWITTVTTKEWVPEEMLEQNVLNTVLGATTGSAREDARSKPDAADASAFGAALDDASRSKGSGKAAKEEKSDAKSEAKEARKKEARDQEEARLAKHPQDASAAIHLKKMMHKNTDTLSLAEKQALRVAEFAGENQQPLARQAVPQSPTHQVAVQPGKSPRAETSGQAASPQVHQESERVDKRTAEAVEQLQKQEQGRPAPTSLEGMIAKEADFASELQKTQQATRSQERQSVIDQILQQVEVRNLANRTELNLKLNPEYLGELKVKLVHTDDGIRADFETSSKRTRELLREGEEDLKTQANAKGVRLRSTRFRLVDSQEMAGEA